MISWCLPAAQHQARLTARLNQSALKMYFYVMITSGRRHPAFFGEADKKIVFPSETDSQVCVWQVESVKLCETCQQKVLLHCSKKAPVYKRLEVTDKDAPPNLRTSLRNIEIESFLHDRGEPSEAVDAHCKHQLLRAKLAKHIQI